MESPALDQKFSCCGIPISRMDLESALISIFAEIHLRKPRTVRLVNSYSISVAMQDVNYFRELAGEGLNLLDSKNVSRIYSFLFWKLKPVPQVRGYDLFLKSLEDRSGIRHVFIGSTEDTLQKMRTKILELFPWQSNVAFYSPPFLDDIENLVVDISTQFVPREGDFIWLSLGTPKQDRVAHILSLNWNTTVVAIGAAFDYFAGNLPDCPKIVSSLGLEWLFRLCLEPSRLWRRYLFGNLTFLKNVVRYFLIDRKMNMTILQS